MWKRDTSAARLASQDNGAVFCKYPRQGISMKERKVAHDQSEEKGSKHSVMHPPFGSLRLTGTDVLCNICGHGLRI